VSKTAGFKEGEYPRGEWAEKGIGAGNHSFSFAGAHRGERGGVRLLGIFIKRRGTINQALLLGGREG